MPERQQYTSLCGAPLAKRVEPLTNARKQLVLEHVRGQVQACLAALHKESSHGPADPKLSALWLALFAAEAEINKLIS